VGLEKPRFLRPAVGATDGDGLLAVSRNPKCFGELLTCQAFALLAAHWAPFVVVGLYLLVVWLPDTRRKDHCLAGYPQFEE
jgi:steroid 5-alpha reductase family enzyme